MKTSTIKAIAHSIPVGRLTQEQLVERFGEKAVKSITRMSGIKERRIVEPGQTAADLALAAAERLLGEKKVNREKVDLLVFASQTPDYRIPATSSVLHGRLGLSRRCSTFDINQACSSFTHSLQVAHSMIVAGSAKCVLILNGDALSTLVNPYDRGLVLLHGDAGAACLVEESPVSEGGIEYVRIGTDGTQFDRIIVPAGAARKPADETTKVVTTDEDGCSRNQEQLFMDGPAVFHFVVYEIADILKQALSELGRTVADYDHVLLHQANRTMIDLVYRSLDVPEGKRFYYLENTGNASGASTPMLLSEAWRQGFIKPGSRSLICAFGGGLSWGVVSIKWPRDIDAAVTGDVETPLVVKGETCS